MMFRSMLVLLTALSLVGCSERAKTAEAAGEAKPVFDPAHATELADYSGSFEVVYQDGSGGTVHFAGNGTVTAKFGDQDVTASYSVPEPGKVCFDKVSTGDPPHCWHDEKADGKGGWSGLMDDDTAVKITPAP
jgi:hypothetical protein